MIMRRPCSRTATRRDHVTEATRNAQVTAAEVKEQAKSLFETSTDARPLFGEQRLGGSPAVGQRGGPVYFEELAA